MYFKSIFCLYLTFTQLSILVLQDEIKFIVTDDPQEAKRVLWMQRRFTHKPNVDKNSPNVKRVDQSKIQLEDYLPDTQKLVFYVKWHEEGIDPANFEEDESYVSEMCETLKEELKKLIDGLLEEDFLEEATEIYRGKVYIFFSFLSF